jgi:pimeloyl-ACP methyl ester carboxylesterase
MTFWLDTLGASNHLIDVNGVKTRVIEAGEGTPIIMLSGFGGHVECYVKNILPLAGRYWPVAIDMIGHGLTDAPDVEYLLPDFIDHIIRTMDAMKIDKAHFMGISMGGWFAFWLGRQYPDRVLSYTSATGSGLGIDGFEVCKHPGVIRMRELSLAISASPDKDLVRERLAWLFHKPEQNVTEELVETRFHMLSRPELRAVYDRVMRMLDHEYAKAWYIKEDDLRAFQPPLNFIWTRHNPSIPWEVAERASAFVPRKRFTILEDAGHWAQYEKPEEFNANVLAFLDDVESGRI